MANANIIHDEGQEEFDGQAPEGNEIEATARRLGWRPKEEYKGPADKWVDAPEYIRQAEEEFPKLKHANKSLERKLAKLENGMAEVLEHQKRQIAKTREDAYNEGMAAIEAKYKQAVAAGDVEGAEKAWKAKEALDKQTRQPEQPAQKRLSDDDTETLRSWMDENKWFKRSKSMREEAQGFEQSLAEEGVPLAERLEQTTQHIQRMFPKEFDMAPQDEINDDEPTTPTPRSMPRGSNRSGVRQPAKKAQPGSYEALTPAGRQACDRFVAMNGGRKDARAEWLRFATPDLFAQ